MCCVCNMAIFCLSRYGDHRDLHGLTHSFPTRRSADLAMPHRPRSVWSSRQSPNGLGCQPQRIVNPSPRRLNSPGVTASCVTNRSCRRLGPERSEEHTSELQSLMRISYAVFCLKQKKHINKTKTTTNAHTKYSKK